MLAWLKEMIRPRAGESDSPAATEPADQLVGKPVELAIRRRAQVIADDVDDWKRGFTSDVVRRPLGDSPADRETALILVVDDVVKQAAERLGVSCLAPLDGDTPPEFDRYAVLVLFVLTLFDSQLRTEGTECGVPALVRAFMKSLFAGRLIQRPDDGGAVTSAAERIIAMYKALAANDAPSFVEWMKLVGTAVSVHVAHLTGESTIGYSDVVELYTILFRQMLHAGGMR